MVAHTYIPWIVSADQSPSSHKPGSLHQCVSLAGERETGMHVTRTDTSGYTWGSTHATRYTTLTITINWPIDNPFVGPSKMTFSLTKGRKLHTTLWRPIRILNLLCTVCYVHLQCLTLRAFLHLLEHQASFQALCQYINCPRAKIQDTPRLTMTINCPIVLPKRFATI